MIFGAATTFYLGYPEIWRITIYGIAPTHHHKGDAINTMIRISGERMDDIYSIWLESSDSLSILSGNIFSANASSIEGAFTLGDNQPGRWSLKGLDNSETMFSENFDVLEGPVSAGDLATAVWEHLLGTETVGMAGKVLANVTVTLDGIEGSGYDTNTDSLAAAKDNLDAALADLTAQLSAIKGSGFDGSTDSLEVVREQIEKILTRSRQNNPILQHNITRGLITEQGRKK